MPYGNMKIRTRSRDGTVEILVLINHPMETGQRLDPRTREKIPAHWIQKVTFSLNRKVIAVVDMGIAVSRDPLISIRTKDAKPGDRLRIAWSDNRGRTGVGRATITAD